MWYWALVSFIWDMYSNVVLKLQLWWNTFNGNLFFCSLWILAKSEHFCDVRAFCKCQKLAYHEKNRFHFSWSQLDFPQKCQYKILIVLRLIFSENLRFAKLQIKTCQLYQLWAVFLLLLEIKKDVQFYLVLKYVKVDLPRSWFCYRL